MSFCIGAQQNESQEIHAIGYQMRKHIVGKLLFSQTVEKLSCGSDMVQSSFKLDEQHIKKISVNTSANMSVKTLYKLQ